ncbi:MAG: hypothetical protein ACKOQZ_09365 [Actinomycetota bacterium]
MGFSVLTVENVEQAVARSGPDSGNKGEEAAIGAIGNGQRVEGHPQQVGCPRKLRAHIDRHRCSGGDRRISWALSSRCSSRSRAC